MTYGQHNKAEALNDICRHDPFSREWAVAVYKHFPTIKAALSETAQPCQHKRVDHNLECLDCDEPIWADNQPCEGGWLDMATSPKDGTPVLLKFKDDMAKYNGMASDPDWHKRWEGKIFVGRHNGYTSTLGYDMGWSFAAPVGQGGFIDAWMEGWQPLPLTRNPAPRQPVREVGVERNCNFCGGRGAINGGLEHPEDCYKCKGTGRLSPAALCLSKTAETEKQDRLSVTDENPTPTLDALERAKGEWVEIEGAITDGRRITMSDETVETIRALLDAAIANKRGEG